MTLNNPSRQQRDHSAPATISPLTSAVPEQQPTTPYRRRRLTTTDVVSPAGDTWRNRTDGDQSDWTPRITDRAVHLVNTAVFVAPRWFDARSSDALIRFAGTAIARRTHMVFDLRAVETTDEHIRHMMHAIYAQAANFDVVITIIGSPAAALVPFLQQQGVA